MDTTNKIDPRWDWEDGEEVEFRGSKRIMKKIGNDLWATLFDNTCGQIRTAEGQYKSGYRKIPKPQPIDITLEIFKNTNWYGKKIILKTDNREYKVYSVNYELSSFGVGLGHLLSYVDFQYIP